MKNGFQQELLLRAELFNKCLNILANFRKESILINTN